MTELEQQARKEAEEWYPERRYVTFDNDGEWTAYRSHRRTSVEAYAAALVSERSKPSSAEVDLGLTRIQVDALKLRLKGCEEALEQRDSTIAELRSKPSLMVGFSEEEIDPRMIADEIAEDNGVDDETTEGAWAWRCMLEAAKAVHAAHIANTRAVSIDKLVEVVKEWEAYARVTEDDPERFADLRHRLENIKP